jgi:hypothetical protein
MSDEKKFGYAILNAAWEHKLRTGEPYGFGAVLNDVPLLVQAFGGPPTTTITTGDIRGDS